MAGAAFGSPLLFLCGRCAVYESSHRGLTVCENAVNERDVTKALKEFDDRLILSCEVDRDHQSYVFVVVRRWSNEQDAAFICDWRDDDGKPLPLTHRLVDKVKNLHVASRAPEPDAVAHNDALTERNRREFEDVTEGMLQSAQRRRGRVNAFQRSPVLARTRARLRDKGLDY